MALSKNSVEEEMKDLSTCCVCMEPYNDLERKPKFIPCHHTYCLHCIKVWTYLHSFNFKFLILCINSTSRPWYHHQPLSSLAPSANGAVSCHRNRLKAFKRIIMPWILPSWGDGDEGKPLAAGNSRSIRSGKFYKFPSNKISAERLSSSQPLNCRDLIGHHGDDEGINVVEFSNDGSLFVSGGDGGRILLWPTSKAVDKNWKPKPTAIETEHEKPIWCLAISPDNRRIFIGGSDKWQQTLDRRWRNVIPHCIFIIFKRSSN